jgi:hypothetical protein
LSSVRRAGRCDCLTSRMISSFSDARYFIPHLIPRRPHPRSCFFSEVEVSSPVRRQLPSGSRVPRDAAAGPVGDGSARRRPQAASCQLRGTPSTICNKARGDPFAPVERGNRFLATQPLQHDANLLFGLTNLWLSLHGALRLSGSSLRDVPCQARQAFTTC